MYKLDKPYFFLRSISLRNLLALKPFQRAFPITYVVDVPVNYIRSWGGRKLNENDNPFTASLNGQTLQQSLQLYKEKIGSIRQYHNLTEDTFDDDFFCRERYPWDKKLNSSRKLSVLKSTLQKELKITVNSACEIQNAKIMEAEIHRLRTLHQHIIETGYDEEISRASPLRANLLKIRDDFVVLIRHGEHRVACLPKIGLSEAEIWIRSFDIVDIQKEDETQNVWFEKILSGDLRASPLVNCYGFFFL